MDSQKVLLKALYHGAKAFVATIDGEVARMQTPKQSNQIKAEAPPKPTILPTSNGVPVCHSKAMVRSKFCKDENVDYYYCAAKLPNGKFCGNKFGKNISQVTTTK